MKSSIEFARLVCVEVAPDTKWLFVEIGVSGGISGWGEASLNQREDEVGLAAKYCFPGLIGRRLLPEIIFQDLTFSNLPDAAVSSAVMQALQDVSARLAGLSLADYIGQRKRDKISLYANINRRSRDRSPHGMASSALLALEAGFDAIKIAPFDEVSANLTKADMRRAINAGIDRIEAVREVLGPQKRLMVDCHWRFDEAGAAEMIRAASAAAPHWIECPVVEDKSNIDVICNLRRLANMANIYLAGLETQILSQGFLTYLKAGAYDVMMPDVKYAGGPDEMLRLASLFEQYRIKFSPHNPTGPMCHAHSLHICAVLDSCDLLEHQFDETPLFKQVIECGIPETEGGVASLDWNRPGLGVELSADATLFREVFCVGRGQVQ